MKEVFDKFKDLKVLVIGDVILDKYCKTKVDRISPEAPIPVALFDSEESLLGGAANVALNVSNLGPHTYLIGRVGDDESAKNLSKLTQENNIHFLPVRSSIKTSTKTRFLSGISQLLRVDHESVEENDDKTDLLAIDTIKSIEKEIDLIIVSDYQKGFLTEKVVNYLSTLDKYVAVDTKPRTFTKFKGFNLIKPNFSEAVGIARELGNFEQFENSNEDVQKLGLFLFENLKSNLLITRSKRRSNFLLGITNKFFMIRIGKLKSTMLLEQEILVLLYSQYLIIYV